MFIGHIQNKEAVYQQTYNIYNKKLKMARTDDETFHDYQCLVIITAYKFQKSTII